MAKWLVGLLAGTALVPAMASAQTAADSSASEEARGGDIIVTAQRYEQRLQDVPISISAITSAELQARNVNSIGELQYAVPGFSTYRYGPGQEFYQLQGVSNTLGSSTVGVYLDETPLALDRQGNGLSVQFVDLERVEVLRGPQATLYGEGSMGGTIRYIPATPKLDRFSGSVEAQVGTTKDGETGYRGTAILNAPLVTDKVGLRLAVSFDHIGGWIDSAVTGEADVNGADTLTVRGTLLAKLSDRFTLSVFGAYQDIDQGYQDFGGGATTPLRVTAAALPTPNRDKYGLIQAKAEYDADFATLTGIASYIRRDNRLVADLTPFYLPYLGLFGVPPGTVTQIGNANDYNYNVYNGELRLTSNGDGPLRWLLGVTYRQIDLTVDSSTITGPGTLSFTLIGLDEVSKSKTYAAYGEVSYALTDKLKVTAGARYYKQDLSRDTVSVSLGAVALDSNDGKFDSVNPRFNVSYNFSENSMVYANVAKGFRGGGFNLTSSGGGVVAVPPSYRPDRIWTYEVGTKHQLFDGRLTLDASGYHSRWSDVQSYNFAPGSPIVIVSNSGRVKGWGADVSAVLRPVDGLTLSGTYGWNNLKFVEATGDKQRGDPVDGAVRESYSASAEYRAPLDDNATGFVRVDYQHAGRGQITFRNFGQIIERPSRDLVNVRIGATVDNFEVALFASNLFDEKNPNIIGPFGVYAESLEQTPRILGVNTRFSF